MITEFDRGIWSKWPNRYKAMFFNSLGGLKSVGLVCTLNKNDLANAGVFSQLIHIGSSPPTWGFLFRPPTEEHQTYENLSRNPYFTFSLATSFISIASLHQCSAKYPNDVSELDQQGIKWSMNTYFNVPILEESDIQIIFKKTLKHDMSNGTILIEAEIIRVISNILPQNDGFMKLTEKTLISPQGLNAYAKTKDISPLKYAEP